MTLSKGFTAADIPDQAGRTIMVTGANTGIGFEVAKALANRRARVLLGCRDKDKATDAMARIAASVPDAELAFVPLDQADLTSVKAAAELVEREARLDVLINNAGVMMPPLTRTAQGFEPQFGVNHLGTFALTALLLPKLAEAKASRVVVTSSLAHRSGHADWSDPRAEVGYRRVQRYYDSKLANALFVFELDRRLKASGSPIAAIGCHPGIAASSLMRHSGPFRAVLPLVSLVLNTAAQGAWPALQAATDPLVEGGDYLGPRGLREMSGRSGHAWRTRQARDPALSGELWKRSIEWTGIDPQLPPA